MSCIQATACQPAFGFTNVYHSCGAPAMLCNAPMYVFQLHKAFPKLTTGSSTFQCTKTFLTLTTGASRYRHCTPVCSFGGKGKSENDNEASPWKALERAMGSFRKEQSLEDVLRQQIEKQEYYDDGGSGGNPPGGGSGGSGGSEDEGFSAILDETLQVLLATIGFIFLYIYIIEGEEINVIAKDVIKYLFGGQQSIRLRRLMYQWGSFFQRQKMKKETDPYWLEREILNTPTWWDSPEKYRRIALAYLEAISNR